MIFTENNATQELAVGSVIELGNVIRKFGQNLKLNGNAINVCGGGYYKVSANITLIGTTAGSTTITLLKDGVPYTTRTVYLAVGSNLVVPLDTEIREFGCCADNNSNLTFVLGGTAETVSQISVVFKKD